jgi:hypothetical protein
MVVVIIVLWRFGSRPLVAFDVRKAVKTRGYIEGLLAQLGWIDEDKLDGALCAVR